VNLWVISAGLSVGAGCWLAIKELFPGRPNLQSAIERLGGSAGRPHTDPGRAGKGARLDTRLSTLAPWLPVPDTDLRLLQHDRSDWLASKVTCGALGLCLVPAVDGLLALAGHPVPWSVPVVGSLAVGLALFFAPDLVTKANAATKRADFRHALTSYLDLVVLERGAGAAPTEALEAAAEVGRGWAFEQISRALGMARNACRPPWEGLSELANEIGIAELADLATIAGVAGQEGARILDTLSARAESMRAAALAAAKARAGSRSATMVLPIAMLAGGFLVLLIFPDFYRLFG